MIYKKSWKYILFKNVNSYRIRALKDFSDVSKGEIGGFVHNYHNLSQKGNCWIYGKAVVSKNAVISGNDTVIDDYARMLKYQRGF